MSEAAVSIRTARLGDAAAVAHLTKQLGYDVELSALERRLARVLARAEQRFLIAEIDARAVGWLHATIFEYIETDPFVVIAGLVVDERYRRQGIGRLLMGEAEKWAAERQCSIVRLWSSIARSAAHRFYERIGYRQIKTQHSFAKALGRHADFSGFIPRIDNEQSSSG